MPDEFNPYYVWLGIPPAEQPANYYRLLGIALFEPSDDVIDSEADRQTAHLSHFQGGKHSETQPAAAERSGGGAHLLARSQKTGGIRAATSPPACGSNARCAGRSARHVGRAARPCRPLIPQPAAPPASRRPALAAPGSHNAGSDRESFATGRSMGRLVGRGAGRGRSSPLNQ